jgi:hypothetical protein
VCALPRGLWTSGLRLSESWNCGGTGTIAFCPRSRRRAPTVDSPAELEKGHAVRLLPIAPEFALFLLETAEPARAEPFSSSRASGVRLRNCGPSGLGRWSPDWEGGPGVVHEQYVTERKTFKKNGAVVIEGARATGKTMTALHAASSYVFLDDPETWQILDVAPARSWKARPLGCSTSGSCRPSCGTSSDGAVDASPEQGRFITSRDRRCPQTTSRDTPAPAVSYDCANGPCRGGRSSRPCRVR